MITVAYIGILGHITVQLAARLAQTAHLVPARLPLLHPPCPRPLTRLVNQKLAKDFQVY
jgi:hypothetical protein